MAMRAIGLALLGTMMSAPIARAAAPARIPGNVAPITGAVLKEGGVLEFCAEGAACRSGKHPAAAGAVRQIVAGEFLSAAAASWIALGDRAVNLCYLATSSASITCTPVANAAELLKGTQVAYIDQDDGTRTLKFTPKSGAKSTWEANFNPYPFMAGISAAADVLQKHATRHPGGSAALAAAGGADVCTFIDGGGVTCSSTGGELARDQGEIDSRVARPAAVARPGDPNAVATVYTGGAQRPTFQACTNAVILQMKECNAAPEDAGEEDHRACVAHADANLQECMAEVRYNNNLNR